MILEKPFCDNSIDGLKIIKFIDENKITVFTNLPNIYSDTYEFTKINFKKITK